MSNCIFCSIVAKSAPSYTVYEDTETMAFLDIMPCVPGHTVVIPKKHGLTIHDYSHEELGLLMDTVKKVASGLEKAYKTEILTIGINHGEPTGVPHLHFHVLPRSPKDQGGVIQSVVQQKGNDTLTESQERIAKALS